MSGRIEDLAAGPIVTGGERYPLLDRKQMRVGEATLPIRGEYYDHDRTITTAGPVNPNNYSSPVYNRETVHVDLGQNAEFIQVINKGDDDLAIICSHEGTQDFADETIISPGDTKLYINVYELRCRSPTQGLPYTVTEFYMEKVCCPTPEPGTENVNVVNTPLPTTDSNIDVTLTNLSKLMRWGRLVDPTWIHAAETTAPGALTDLVSKAVTAGKTGYIYGFFIEAQEANNFFINWVSGGVTKSIRIPYGGAGAVESVDSVAMNEGLSADAASTITIQNIGAGNPGIVYQARLLYAEI